MGNLTSEADINWYCPKEVFASIINLVNKTSSKEVGGVILCNLNANEKKKQVYIAARKLIEMKNISDTPEIEYIPEITSHTRKLLKQYATASLVHTHPVCTDPSIGDFCKMPHLKFRPSESGKYETDPNKLDFLYTGNVDIVLTKCFLTSVLLRPHTIYIEMCDSSIYQAKSEKFGINFKPDKDDNIKAVDSMNKHTHTAMLPLEMISHLYNFNFFPRQERHDCDKNVEAWVKTLPPLSKFIYEQTLGAQL